MEGEVLVSQKKNVTFYGISFFYPPIYTDSMIFFITSTIRMPVTSSGLEIYCVRCRTCISERLVLFFL